MGIGIILLNCLAKNKCKLHLPSDYYKCCYDIGFLSVGQYRSIWAQVLRFWYRYLYMSAGVVADICAMARPIKRPWITGKGVCSNSTECATNTSKKFALAWQLDSLGLWCSFCWRCTSAHFAFQPATTTRCDRWPGAQASRYDDRVYIASCAPRLRKICDVI